MLFIVFIFCSELKIPAADVSAVWTGTTGSWIDAARWSSFPFVPNNGVGGFTYDATINSGGVIQDQDITIQNLYLGGGIIKGPGLHPLTLMGSQSSWTAGAILSSGEVSVSSVATLHLQGTAEKQLGNNSLLQVAGITNWTGTGDIVAISQGARLETKVGGIFDIKNDEAIYTSGTLSNGHFTNSGTLRKTAGTENVIAGNWSLSSTGIIDIQTGSLRLLNDPGSIISGQVNVAANTGLSFSNGTHLLNDATIQNNGLIFISTPVKLGNAGSIAGTGKINIVPGGSISAMNLRTNSLELGGVLTIAANGADTGASRIETLTITPSGKLNLNDNDLVIGTGSVTVTRELIKNGMGGLLGITSDVATFGVKTGFGYAAGDDIKLSPTLRGAHALSGQAFDDNSVLIKYTLLGDADLDGDSDLADLGLWASAFTGDLAIGPSSTPMTYWTSGDFDYDGDTDLADLGLWSSTFTGDLNSGPGSLIVTAPNASGDAVAILNGMGITVVPEPGMVGASLVIIVGVIISFRPRIQLRRVAAR
jgi:hypothetical protein